ncbi:hypothetical protein [Nocardia sp. NBC_01327]|uniref:hypothetical protein n=1 Tax=Nocardia sp. NBC_01327 TaxID=2903593 RepID=UPI002E0E0AEE|nr:hypothetical protein OG326_23020 [Nocardia sp. NBC_01327]
MESGAFRPDLSHRHLARFTEQLRAAMPPALWRVIEPWSHRPLHWHDGTGDTTGDVYGLDRAQGSELAVCQVHAPIAWHRVIAGLPEVVFRHPSPSAAQLGALWELLSARGLRPAIHVNLMPWLPAWTHVEVAPGAWAVDVLGVAASGGDIDPAEADELAKVLNGPGSELPVHPTSFPTHQWTYWPTA